MNYVLPITKHNHHSNKISSVRKRAYDRYWANASPTTPKQLAQAIHETCHIYKVRNCCKFYDRSEPVIPFAQVCQIPKIASYCLFTLNLDFYIYLFFVIF